MTDRDRNQIDGARQSEGDDLGRELNAALAKYSSVAPRAGLEDRILANLRTEAARVPERTWWQWSVAGVAAAIIIAIAALALRSDKPSHPVATKNPPAVAPTLGQPPARVGSEVAKKTRPPSVRAAEHVSHRAEKPSVASGPKLDQFPSPQPLSEQELALTRYVSQFPHEATLVARAQYEYELEIQQKMKEAIPETGVSDSDQQER